MNNVTIKQKLDNVISNVAKTSRQIKGIERWYKNGGNGTLVYPTGFGKTNVGLLAIKLLNKINNSEIKVIILVPSTIIYKRWNNEPIIKDNHNIIVITAEQAARQTNNTNPTLCNLLIIDEIQNFSSDRRMELLNNSQIIFTYSLALTGSYPCNKSFFTTFINNNYPILDSISEHEAVYNNWINKSIEIAIPVTLTKEEELQYAEFTKFIKETLNIFDNDIDLLYSCRKGKYINDIHIKKYIDNRHFLNLFCSRKGWSSNLDTTIPYFNEINKVYSPNAIYDRLIKYDDIVRRRLVLVGNAKNKIDTTISILKLIRNSRILIFNAFISICENIKERANIEINNNFCLSYHSKLKTIINIDENGKSHKKGKVVQEREIINKLESGEIHAISTVNSMNEGLNIPNLNIAIITSGTLNPIQEVQRSGRTKRVMENKPISLIINIYVKDSIDEKKLKIRYGAKEIINYSKDDFKKLLKNEKIN